MRCWRRRSRILVLALVVLAVGSSAAARGKKSNKVPKQAIPAPVQWLDVAVREGIAFYARSDGLVLMDVTKPERPVELSRLSIRATIFGIALDGPRAWLAAGSHGLLAVDISDPAAPEVLSRFETPGSVRQVLVSGETAYLADHRQGAVVLDVSLPTRPRRQATISTRGKLLALDQQGPWLATAEGPAGVRLFDVSRPGNPREHWALDDVADARDVTFVGDLLLVAAARDGLWVYRLAHDGGLSRVAVVDTGKEQAQAVWPTAHGAAVAYGGAGLALVDLGVPESPRVLSRLVLPQSYPVERLALAGDRAFIACDAAGFAVVDIAAPEAPTVILPGRRRMKVTFR